MTTTIRVDSELKKECDVIFKELGMTMSTAMNIFLRKVVSVQGIPFDLRAHTPNKETQEVLDAVLRGEGLSGPYESVDEMMEDILRD
jgi:DNA-damage-inducible protein J